MQVYLKPSFFLGRRCQVKWYNTPHWKIIALICFARRSPQVTVITVFVSIVAWKQARWPPLFITFLISPCLVTTLNLPSFIGNLWWVLLLGNHLKGYVSRSNFSCKLQRNKRCVASCEKKNSRVTSHFATAIVALRVTRKVEWPSTFRNVAR